MARARGPINVGQAIASGIQAVATRLAQWFRLGQFGAVQPPEQAQPGRERLTTPEQIVQAAIERHLIPETRTNLRQSERYVCVFTNDDTGEVLMRLTETVESDVGTPRSTRYSTARRNMARRLDRYVPGQDQAFMNISVTCRRIRGSYFTF